MTPPTVVHVLGSLGRGGAEHVLLDVLRTLDDGEFRTVCLTLAGRQGELAPRFREAGAETADVPLHPVPTFPVRLFARLQAVRPDAVVSHVGLPSGLVLAVAALARVPHRVAHVHSEGDGRTSTRARILQRRALRRLLRCAATRITGVTPGSVTFAGGALGAPHCAVVPNGVDLDRFAFAGPRPDGPPVLVHIGRAAPEKNRGFLLRMHAALDGRAVLRLVGPGGTADLQAADPDFARRPGLLVHGATDRVEDVLTGAAVLVLPSLREGLPGVVLQALASGVPVLSADLPGVRGVAEVTPGVRVLPLSAGPRAWAAAALELAACSAERRAEIAAAFRASPFDLRDCATAWRRLWTA
ncbi:glycosyltransferase [Saccharopolyspora sp. HNM0983]|uniref:Glycosyltransferase n=1 Tax=Saccharopolyspora montiporae TaxID=2781240 RepID=A0A929BED8_9PSEU|nr:glycosyltransferase [Saccharopolyspora sp. HNM0983]MBE9376498.1 glycosyltransferase [Saccharopolyspora sp. HNM0983]